ncbi:MAG: arginine--tRNA ligase [Oscillospiraceae bacterium]|nr:arginine--tRNA ligase [Oscillospiraceae bacterium]
MNMIQSAKEQVLTLTQNAYRQAVAAGLLPDGVELIPAVEIPKDAANGDYTTTYCLAAAKAMRKNPREVAAVLTGQMTLEGSYFTSVEIAGPGFLNFRLGPQWYADTVAAIEREGDDYGANDSLAGQRIMVEFVSANPTGPMHMGNARGGVLGDTLASVLAKNGADVWREFYVNDAGNQIEKFAKSLEARYLQLIRGEDAVEFPEDGYHGEDIKVLAKAFYDLHGEEYLACDEARRHEALARFGLEHNIPKMKTDLERYGIRYDQWFFESSLHESGYVADTVQALTDMGYTYEQDGALWLATARILTESLRKAGKSEEEIARLELKDDVLRRANGFYTYFAADIAYHRNKFAVRGFDRVINIWGADHHGHVARLKGAMDALGLNGTGRLDIVLMQLVKLVENGEVVRMSKRTGKAVSLTDLLDMVPVDACRYFFNAKPESQMEFDLGLAVRQDSENPVYYVQYAHARICNLLKTLAAEGYQVPAAAEAELSLLQSGEELALIKELGRYGEVVALASRSYDPSHINRYLTELAAAFHKFYNACRIKGEAENVLLARLKLADTTRSVLKNAMTLIGCTAPEKM